MDSDAMKKIKKGCGKQLARKKWALKNYGGSGDAHFMCGNKHPKSWKNDGRVAFDRFYCDKCKMSMRNRTKKEWLMFLEDFYLKNRSLAESGPFLLNIDGLIKGEYVRVETDSKEAIKEIVKIMDEAE